MTKSDIFAVIEGCSQATADAHGFQSQVVKVWHIGIQYLSPFKPTFRECTVSEGQNLSADVIEVKASPFLVSNPVGSRFQIFRGWPMLLEGEITLRVRLRVSSLGQFQLLSWPSPELWELISTCLLSVGHQQLFWSVPCCLQFAA